MKKYGLSVKGKTTISLSIFFIFFLTSIASANEEAKFPFDPSQIEMDDAWEEVLLVEGGFYPRWCGPGKIFYFTATTGFKLINIFTREVKSFPENDDYRDYFMDCTPSGSHVVFKRRNFKKKNDKSFQSIVVFDTNSGKEAAVLPDSKEKLPSVSSFPYSLLSPDGKYMAWYEKGKLRVNDEYKIKLVPVSKKAKEEFLDLAWSPDSRKIFILPRGDMKALTMYDVMSDRYSTYPLDFDKHTPFKIAVSSDGNSIYFQAALFWHFRNYLYRFDFNDLHSSASQMKPLLLANGFSYFTLGPDGKIVFSPVPPPDSKSEFPFAFAGIYLADRDGKVTGRLTADNYDLGPRFSQNGSMIVFERVTTVPGKWKDYIYLLIRKN